MNKKLYAYYQMATLQMTLCDTNRPNFRFSVFLYIYQMAEDWVLKCYTLVGDIKYLRQESKLFPKWAWTRSHDSFKMLGPLSYLWNAWS